MPTWHCKGREEPSMVFSRDRRIISVPKSSWEGSTKKEYIRRFLAATKMMKYFMQASYNITGQKNGANIWITLDTNRYFAQSPSRTTGTIRYFVSFSVPSTTNGENASMRTSSRLSWNYAGHCSELNKEAGQITRFKKTSQLPRGSGPREARLACILALT